MLCFARSVLTLEIADTHALNTKLLHFFMCNLSFYHKKLVTLQPVWIV
jgi:hypothetical protein